MFDILGKFISRMSPLLLGVWLAVWAGTWYFTPPWEEVARDQEFGFLPDSAPSRRSEALFAQAFPHKTGGSNVVLLMERRDQRQGLTEEDTRFIQGVLEPGLRKIAEDEGGLAYEIPPSEESPFTLPAAGPPIHPKRSLIARIRVPSSFGSGALLVSDDGRAWLVIVDLTSEFLSRRNGATLARIEDLLESLKRQAQVPSDLDIFMTGSAVIGRDRIAAQLDSARATERWTLLLVVVLLVLIYRAPLLTVIPLLTVYLAVRISIQLLSILAGAGHVALFEGIQIYTMIVAYGAGIDYCLFLTARYKEELDRGGGGADALARSIGKVGAALTASAATVMGGIGMMVFADFGKFRQAGIAMPLSILMVLLATLTFAAPLLHLWGRWAFWPQHRPQPGAEPAGGSLQGGFIPKAWTKLGQVLLRRPGMLWLASVAVMAPFVAAAVALRNHQTYDLIEGLPAEAPSVVGTRVLQKHFPAGMMGPVAVLLVNSQVDFATPQGEELIAHLTRGLQPRMAETGLADLRTLTSPLGVTPAAQKALNWAGISPRVVQEIVREEALERFATDFGERKKIGTRLDLVLDDNPFSRRSMDSFERIETLVQEALPGQLREGAHLYFGGPTSSIRDLRTVKNADQVRIEILVLAIVFLILLLLLRALLVSMYLIVSVLFSYFAALGVSYAVFWLLAPGEFTGLDWKVSMFLFTILIAVGEDYNIFLTTRVREEQETHGPVRGVAEAVVRTGPIISSCGLIMAGTFASLLMGSLAEMQQLGFALSFGVLLDTFVVRPVLVPAFLIAIHQGQFDVPGWVTSPSSKKGRQVQEIL